MEELDIQVRRVDEDRWLASRFAPAQARAALTVLYALNYEIARTPETVSQPTLGAIRLAWWREAIGEAYDGRTSRAHPVAAALAAIERPWPRATLESLTDARERDLDAAPFADWDELDAYVDATAGAVLSLALTACGAAMEAGFVRDAGRAWGYAGLARRGSAGPEGGQAALIARARAAYAAARAVRPPEPAFGAVGYVALTGRYLDALERGERSLPLFERHLRVLAASATGRL